MKENTLRHLAAARKNRKLKPTDFIRTLAMNRTKSGQPARKELRRQIRARKSLANHLRSLRKEHGNQLARVWHRAGY